MKRCLGILVTLLMLALMPALAEPGTTPQCEDCGGDAQLTTYLSNEETHVAACPHGVTDETTRTAHTPTGEYLNHENTCWQKCSVCAKEYGHYLHAAWCTSPNICAHCGGEYTGDLLRHDNVSSVPWQHDTNKHWKVCPQCVAQCLIGEHYVNCSNPGYCVECEAEVSISDYDHDIDYSVIGGYDENNHWYLCKNCDLKVNVSAHNATCTDPTHCCDCGCDYSGDNIRHLNLSDELFYDEYEHWYYCSSCESHVWGAEHYANCNDLTICGWCGIPYSGNQVSHQINYDEYAYNEDGHWYECTECGNKVDFAEHFVICADLTHCYECGCDYSADYVDHYNVSEEIFHDEHEHWYYCYDCESRIWGGEHFAMCNNLTICGGCGVPYSGDLIYHHMNYDEYAYDEDEHWYVCTECGATEDKEEHNPTCKDPTHCCICGQACNKSEYVNHSGIVSEAPEYDKDGHWYYCEDCETNVYYSKHMADCRDRTKCSFCGYKADYSEGAIMHFTSLEEYDAALRYDDLNHWRECPNCYENFDVEEHIPDSDNAAICKVCSQPITACVHNVVVDAAVAAKCKKEGLTKGSHCSLCGEIIVAQEKVKAKGHSYALSNEIAPECGIMGKKTYTCTRCNASYTSDITALSHDWQLSESVAPGCESAGTDTYACSLCGATDVKTLEATGHSWLPTEEITATCEQAGAFVTACANCEAAETVEIPMLAHNYGTFKSQDDRTHIAACTGCEANLVKNCVLSETVIGNLSVSTCPVCGYTESKPITQPEDQPVKEEPSPLDDLEVVEVVTAVLENVTIDAGENSALPENASLSVHEQTLVLKDDTASVKLFTVGIVVDGEAFELQESMKLGIPCEDEQAVVGMKLVLILPNGTFTDISFEIIDGVMVFETNVVGTFALIPIKEAA